MSGCSPLAFASEIEVNRGVDMVAVLKVVTDESTDVTLACDHDLVHGMVQCFICQKTVNSRPLLLLFSCEVLSESGSGYSRHADSGII